METVSKNYADEWAEELRQTKSNMQNSKYKYHKLAPDSHTQNILASLHCLV